MDDIVVDTHVVIWHFSNPAMLSETAESHLDKAEAVGAIYVSSITIVELVYLIEKSKIPPDILTLLRDALDDRTTAFRLVELSREVADQTENIPRAIVPDMPDRIISATALHLDLPLVTRDRMISQLTAIKTIW